MQKFVLLFLCAVTLGLGGCASKPLTESEFKGFCYTTIGRRNSCDTIPLCDEFATSVLSSEYASRQACSSACLDVYNRLYGPNQFDGCAPTLFAAFDWCKKYCNTNYPE